MYGKKLKAVLRIEIVLRVLLGCGEKNHPALRAPLLEEEGRGLCYGICPQKTLSPPLPRGGGTVFGDGGVLPPPHFVGRGLGGGVSRVSSSAVSSPACPWRYRENRASRAIQNDMYDQEQTVHPEVASLILSKSAISP